MSSTEVEYCTNCEYTLKDFLLLSSDPDKLKTFLYAHKLIPTTTNRICECGHVMTFHEDYGYFKCFKRHTFINSRRKRELRVCLKTASELKGTFFESRGLKLETICDLIAYWCFIKPPRLEFLMEELNLTRKTLLEYFGYICEVCALQLGTINEESDKLGGPGLFVQIVRTKIKKRKQRDYLSMGNWIFAGLEPVSGKIFAECFADCNEENLLHIIDKYILPKTVVVSDCWKSYNIQNEGFQQLITNQSISFVDSGTINHHRKLEKLWRELKSNASRFANGKIHSHEHLLEFLYRCRYFRQYKLRIHNIFTSIAKMYNITTSASINKGCNDISLSNDDACIETSIPSSAKECYEKNSCSIDKISSGTSLPSNAELHTEVSIHLKAEKLKNTSSNDEDCKDKASNSIANMDTKTSIPSNVDEHNETSISAKAENIKNKTSILVTKMDSETSIPSNVEVDSVTSINLRALFSQTKNVPNVKIYYINKG